MKRAIVVALIAVLLGGTKVSSAYAEADFKITPDVIYGHKAGMALTFDVIYPKEPNGAAILFMVSGAWVSTWFPPEGVISTSAPDHFKFFRTLTEKGYTLFIVRHGSSPQFKVPEAVADVRRAVRYIHLHADDFKIDPNRIGVSGMSAGGHLSLMLGVASDEGDKNSKDEIEKASDRVAAVVAYFPPVDLREWVGDKRFPALHFDAKDAEGISPIVHVSKDDAPTLLIHGDKDDLVKLDNSERIVDAFKKDNVACELLVIKGAGHGFLGEQGKEAGEALVKWFDKYLAKPADGAATTASDAKSEKAEAAVAK